jgi:hypothetical protein
MFLQYSAVGFVVPSEHETVPGLSVEYREKNKSPFASGTRWRRVDPKDIFDVDF